MNKLSFYARQLGSYEVQTNSQEQVTLGYVRPCHDGYAFFQSEEGYGISAEEMAEIKNFMEAKDGC